LNVADEARLLELARQYDTDALAQIHDDYYGPIFRYIAFRVSDRETAEDLASEVFLRFLKALREQKAPQTTLRGWLFSVAAHIVSDYHRRHYRAPHVALTENIESQSITPADHVEAQLDRDDLREAVATLTEDQQQVIALRFGYDMPIQNVAQTLGKTEGAVKQLQARAIAALARRMHAGVGE
jgi:RNA polymerase sigma-70 factor (ECF subfamily)